MPPVPTGKEPTRNPMRKLTVILVVLLFPLLSQAAKLDTSFTFSTLETEHFSIHFHQGLEGTAQRTAAIAEELYPAMTAAFMWQPAEKTQIVLIDDSDFTNGLAAPVPYNTIYLQPVPPALDWGLGEYDDWLRTLFVHEYTHILTSDPVRGYARVMRNIFGKPIPGGDLLSLATFIAAGPPNMFMPRWWHEGIATWGETEFTAKGRGKSSYYDMIFRSAVAEGNLPAVDKINGDVPYWPDGHLPYVFGMRLARFIADTYGTDAPGKLSNAHSGRFPYAITTPPEELSKGRDYADLYRAMLIDVQREQRAHIEALAKKPFSAVEVISRNGENLTNPRYSPDGTMIAYTKRDPHEHTKLVVMTKEGKVIREVRRTISDGNMCWSADGNTIYFTQAEIIRGFNVYEDLYAYDMRSGSVKRLTDGRRIKDAEISPDGKHFAAVVSNRGSQNLALWNAEGLLKGNAAEPRMATGFELMRVSSPRWSPDGRSIAYTVTDDAGTTGIHIFDTQSGKDRPLFSGRFTSAWPVWSRDGRHILYVSDESGVFNIFAWSLDEGKIYQISHLLTGALQPDLSPDGRTVVFSLYGSRGFAVASICADRENWTVERSPAIPSSWQTDNDASPSDVTTKAASTRQYGETADAPRPYSPIGTLLPRFWLPTASSDGTGVRIGAFTAGQDVLGYHTYVAQAEYGAKYRRPFYSLFYQNDNFYPSFSLKGYEEPVLYSDLLERGDYSELNRGLIAKVSVPLNFIESNYRFVIGYHLQDETHLSDLTDGRFNGLPVFQGRRDNAFAGIDFTSVLKYPWSISGEEGRNISLRYRYYGKEVGSEIRSDEYEAAYDEYFPLPGRLLRHHVAWLRLSGAIATGNRTVQQAFQLGGVPSDLNRFPLRGYPSRFESGKYAATGTLEYHAPIWYFLRGAGTQPFFFDRLHGAAFVDAGEVWDDSRSFRADRIRTGAGIEARFDMTVGYWLKITPTLGVARGFNTDGENQVYFIISMDI